MLIFKEYLFRAGGFQLADLAVYILLALIGGASCISVNHTLSFPRGRFYRPPLFDFYTSTICSSQSMQAIRTVRVALTLMPQLGQIYLRVLDVLGGLPVISTPPLCVPVLPIKNPAPSFRFIRISVRPFSITKSSSSSVGSVCDHPYLSLCVTVSPHRAALK